MVRSCSVKNFQIYQVFNLFFCNSLIVFSRQISASFVFFFLKAVLHN